jgi:thiol-disulfide isomerase/thioredoxin
MKTWIRATLTAFAAVRTCMGADILVLNSGEKIPGTVTGYSDMTFHIQTIAGSKLDEPLITVRSVEFADSATQVSLDVRATGKVQARILQYENSKFAIVTKDGEIDKIPASSVVSMQWGERPERAAPVRRVSAIINPADREPQAIGGNPSKIDFVKGDRQIRLEAHIVPGKITIVDFYADWCGPCRMLGPQLEDMAAKNPNIALVKINIIDWESPVAKQFNITGIPRVQVYDPSDRLVGTSVGVRPAEIAAYVKRAQSR